MIELQGDELRFSFPEIHPDAICHIQFQRTLRIPDDNRNWNLPPGLGRFPLRHVEDHASRLPATWQAHGGVLLPMYQAEALWINFSARGYPFAVKIAAGKINAVSGKAWDNALCNDPQDYVQLPEQPWLDGFCVQQGLIRQFVAMPLGAGYTAEEQLTGAAEDGGLQLIVYPMKRARYEKLLANRRAAMNLYDQSFACHGGIPAFLRRSGCEMGLAPGGLMHQEIYQDEYGLDAWDTTAPSRCFVHLLNSAQWQAATGAPACSERPVNRAAVRHTPGRRHPDEGAV